MDSNDQRAREIIRQGQASIDELLAAAFGHWPPRGLDIVHANPRTVVVTDDIDVYDQEAEPEEKQELKRNLGLARFHGPRRIFINADKIRNSGELTRTLAHETAHILQGDHCRYRSNEILGFAGAVKAAQHTNHISDTLVKTVWVAHRKRGWLRKKFNAFANPGLDYYADGAEIQARLHEALVTGYQSWQRLPQNRDEFYFAMISLGFAMTPEITKQISHHTKAETLRDIFRHAGTGNEYAFVDDVGLVEKNLHAAGRMQLWAETLPGLYCDLIEMYGDRYGRERFRSFGPNEIHAFRQRYNDDIALLQSCPWHFQNAESVGGDYLITPYGHMSESERERFFSALHNVAQSFWTPPATATDQDKWLLIKEQAVVPFMSALGLKPPATPQPSATSPASGRGQRHC